MALGLASRRYAALLPDVVAQYAGDTLWATMAFVGVGILRPRWSTIKVAATALMVAYSVEASQVYHAPWIDAIRRNQVGALVLGYGFLWSDIACYTGGVALGVAIEIAVRNAKTRRQAK